MAGVAILIAWISVCAPLLPTVSISQAVLSTSSRSCSRRTRDSAIQSRTTPCSDSGLPNAVRDDTRRAHQLDGPLGHADRAHAVVDPARAQPGLRDGEPVPLAGDEVLGGHPDVVEDELGVAAVVAVVVAHDRHRPRPPSSPGRVPRHEDHALLPVALGRRVGLAHHDEDRAVAGSSRR